MTDSINHTRKRSIQLAAYADVQIRVPSETSPRWCIHQIKESNPGIASPKRITEKPGGFTTGGYINEDSAFGIGTVVAAGPAGGSTPRNLVLQYESNKPRGCARVDLHSHTHGLRAC